MALPSRTLLPAALLLLLLCILGIATVASDPGKNSNCCTQVSRAKPKLPIIAYRRQEMALPCVEAVIFTTQEGKLLCSNPELKWVKDKVNELDKKTLPQ
ncbi:monocyte chemotactic protein 1B-like [Rhinatrema bivittatum]|uniref:monocyte chemotactic protein 1B-like n=1 Tax=Rhinatrema bivittatum TaxID=194408 RepID=UPI001129A38A|nr:monocyte chemotactic protein 1B-like [Rhinatrema bivittatum]